MTDNENTKLYETDLTLEDLIKDRLDNCQGLRYERVLFDRLNAIVIRATGRDLKSSLSTLDKLAFLRCIVDYHQSIDVDFRDDFSGNFFDLLN